MMQTQTILLIADISGFTRFIAESEPESGYRQAREMLDLIVRSNSLGLELCEVEGDAIFFYLKNGKPSADRVLYQIRKTFREFQDYLFRKNLDDQLGIKFVVHTGECKVLKVAGTRKLFGLDVIKIHRLLKCAQDGRNYFLITEEAAHYLEIPRERASRGETTFDHLGSVSYLVFNENFLWVHPSEAKRRAAYGALTSVLQDLATGRYGEVPRMSWIRTVMSA